MTFRLTIETDNAAFDPPGLELAAILHRLADKLDGIDATWNAGNVRDTDGNTVGGWTFGDETDAR